MEATPVNPVPLVSSKALYIEPAALANARSSGLLVMLA